MIKIPAATPMLDISMMFGLGSNINLFSSLLQVGEHLRFFRNKE